MKIKNLTLALVGLLLMGMIACSPKGRGFAIVIDPKSYEEAKAEVEAYAAELEKSGLTVHTVIDKWGVPDSIRQVLIDLYNCPKAPIEGAIFLGDIPVPMVRDAQHMTSAFKMDQDVYPWHVSSVPTDRFYDDFDLKFKFLKQDEERPHMFYYSLTADSEQELGCEIYTGRVRPTDCNGTCRYEKLRSFLKKAVYEKQHPEVMDQMLFFSGHGYVSESLTARLDEKLMYMENFPWFKKQRNGIEYIDHKQDRHIKFRVMNEMQRKDLDFAILHHHGDWDTQYMSDGIPEITTAKPAINFIQDYLRAALRHAKDRGRNVDSMRVALMKRFDVPRSWFAGAFDAEVMKADSTDEAKCDLVLSDFDNYSPQCRVVLFDACFNGSFHRDNCIANAYIFGEGNRTIAVTANSVNVLQDKWTDRYTGAMALGMNVGRISQLNPYLEGHLIGDPTYAFIPAVKVPDLNEAIATWCPSRWKKEFKNTEYTAVKALALKMLFDKDAISSAELLNIFKESDESVIRMEAMMLLSKINDDNFIECLSLAVNDSHEMVARFAMNFVQDSGDARLVPGIISVAIRNNTSERVNFSVSNAIPLYDNALLMAEFERQFPTTNYQDSAVVRGQISKVISGRATRYSDYMQDIFNPEKSMKSRLQSIRSMRNYHVHFMVPELLEYMQQTTDTVVQKNMLEAFGWFKRSYRAPEIKAVAEKMSNDASLCESVRNEALKTYNRL
ncbi:MAG: hypothetical protein IJY36_04265 [Coprobacter sp.]|nr:hypothetical protein [Coprobacter sp.]